MNAILKRSESIFEIGDALSRTPTDTPEIRDRQKTLPHNFTPMLKAQIQEASRSGDEVALAGLLEGMSPLAIWHLAQECALTS